MKDPLINHAFSVDVKNEIESKFELSLYSRNFNLQNKETIYDDLKIGEISINLSLINENLKKEKEITISHQFGGSASISIKYSLLHNKINSGDCDPLFKNKANNEFAENEFLTNELIENFHKTLNEINRDVNIYELPIPTSQKNLTGFNQMSVYNQYSNKKEAEDEEEPSKLEKTMVFFFLILIY